MKVTANRLFDGQRFTGSNTVHIQNGLIQSLEPGGIGQAALVTPGFIDSHLHLIYLGLDLQGLRLYDCCSRHDFTKALTDFARDNPEGWLVGRGWHQDKLGFTPHRQLLDELFPQRPVVLSRVCGHVVAANSKAMELAGITDSTRVPGGAIRRDSSGRSLGILEEKAGTLITSAIPPPDMGTIYTALIAAIKYVHSCGITGGHTDDLRKVNDYYALWDLYTRVTESHPLRVQLHHSISSPEELREYVRLAGEIQDTDFVRKGAAKLMLDGSLGGGTAALMEEYSDHPSNKGVLICEDETVREIMTIAEAHSIPLAAHSIGDRSTEQFLRVLTQVRGGLVPGPVRHRLIHVQVTNPSQLQRAKCLNLALEIQPVFLQTDMHWVESRIGPERLQNSYCWQTMDKMGLFLSGGSDCPVEDANPWLGVDAAVTRRDRAGRFASGWHKDEALSLERALSLFTSSPAELADWQDLGKITPGSRADLAIYRQFSEAELASNRPDQVLIQGEIVYKR